MRDDEYKPAHRAANGADGANGVGDTMPPDPFGDVYIVRVPITYTAVVLSVALGFLIAHFLKWRRNA